MRDRESSVILKRAARHAVWRKANMAFQLLLENTHTSARRIMHRFVIRSAAASSSRFATRQAFGIWKAGVQECRRQEMALSDWRELACRHLLRACSLVVLSVRQTAIARAFERWKALATVSIDADQKRMQRSKTLAWRLFARSSKALFDWHTSNGRHSLTIAIFRSHAPSYDSAVSLNGFVQQISI